MSRIYKTTDRIKVSIDDITVKVSPLSYSQKMEIQALMSQAIKNNDMKYAMDGTVLAIKYSLKSISGLKTQDDEDYQIEFENKMVSDSSIDDILNMGYSNKLAAVCNSLVKGIGQDIIDPITKEAVEGISFEGSNEEKK